jgi:hypothetical protein
MKARIQKRGHTLGGRMTKSAAKKVGILACRKQKYTLAQLLKGVRPDNIHPAVDWGPPVGKELL